MARPSSRRPDHFFVPTTAGPFRVCTTEGVAVNVAVGVQYEYQQDDEGAEMPRIAGHDVTDAQLVALHGLYQGLVKTEGCQAAVYGKNVQRQLDTLADQGIIARGGWSYTIPWTGPGADIIAATSDFSISAHL